MKLPRRKILSLATAAAALAAVPRKAWPESYPSRPVRVVVPFAPGGPTDIFARLIVQKLSEQLGKQFYIENVDGASGSIGTAQVARAAPDGYTILFNVNSFAINPVFFDKVPYDPFKDFEFITLAARNDVVFAVNPAIPAKTVAEFVALAKARDSRFTFSSGGTGSVTHLVGAQFALSVGLDVVHIPYSGAGPAVAAAVAGHVPAVFSSMPPVVPHIADGRLRALAVTGKVRSPSLPDVPTMAEAGYPETKGDQWVGAFAPARTPKDIVAVLNRELAKALATADIKERFATIGFVPVASSPEEFAALVKSDTETWSKVIRAGNLRPE
ncbi:MAG: tripartite tricarboxylate transporter substrate binding protein [Alphaproteobacteria bacterium]|nr:MAG: tripartite tricarboxylate transporter substrate binding protein [Alphaproteobacteria bacterium]